METQIKTYDNAGDYQQSVVDHQQERSIAGKLFVPGGLFTKGKSQIVVTWQREAQPLEISTRPGYAADGRRLTLKENIELAKRKRHHE